ncbi:MAG: hypothetical protein Q7J29_09890, partial [Stagnimonas sp.]|nr:hypothetical protein [Stagnimonas sp.]
MKQNEERGIGRLSAFALAIGMMSATSAVVAQEATVAAPPAVDTTTPVEPEPAATDSKSVKLDKVQVTGSRIKSPNLTSSSPITTVNSAEIKFQGTTRVEDLLNSLPQ